MSALEHARPCRVCHNPAWTADDQGPVHHCCAAAAARGRPCPYCKPAPEPLARYEDPPSSHEAAARIAPKAGTRRSQVLDALLAAKGDWVDGWTLCTQRCGGTEGLRRLRELRPMGWVIEVRSHPDPAQTGDQYRIDPEGQQQAPEAEEAAAVTPEERQDRIEVGRARLAVLREERARAIMADPASMAAFGTEVGRAIESFENFNRWLVRHRVTLDDEGVDWDDYDANAGAMRWRPPTDDEQIEERPW